METVDFRQHIPGGYLLAGLGKDAADSPLDLRSRESLLIRRKLNRAVDDGDYVRVGLWYDLLLIAVHPGFVFVTQQSCQQRVADEDDLVPWKRSVQNFDVTIFAQAQLHSVILVLAGHPLHEQVRPCAATDDGIRGADNCLLNHLDTDFDPPEHARPEEAIRVFHGRHNALGPRLAIHLPLQVVDLASILRVRTRQRTWLQSLVPFRGIGPRTPERLQQSRGSTDRPHDKGGLWG